MEQCFHETKTPLLLPLLRSGDDLFQGTSRCRKTPFIGISPNSVKAFVRVMPLRALAGKLLPGKIPPGTGRFQATRKATPTSRRGSTCDAIHDSASCVPLSLTAPSSVFYRSAEKGQLWMLDLRIIEPALVLSGVELVGALESAAALAKE